MKTCTTEAGPTSPTYTAVTLSMMNKDATDYVEPKRSYSNEPREWIINTQSDASGYWWKPSRSRHTKQKQGHRARQIEKRRAHNKMARKMRRWK